MQFLAEYRKILDTFWIVRRLTSSGRNVLLASSTMMLNLAPVKQNAVYFAVVCGYYRGNLNYLMIKGMLSIQKKAEKMKKITHFFATFF